jgi:Kyakuja-Dileera-Zisupton transposase
MDYSICEALKRFPSHVQALIIYDICCQWSLHFRQRVSESDFLELYDSLEIIGAVGKWHLAAHIPECFPKFTLNFVEGAGEVDGEIMETLWSKLDEIAGFTQAMSIAHAQEVIDDYMNDSNWRKLIRMGRSPQRMHRHVELTLLPADALCGKWTRAKKGVSETKPAFEQLTECLDAALVQEWTKQERIAMEQRGDHLKIYEVASDKCG